MMYEVSISRVYVAAATAEMAIRQTARTLKNGRLINAHPMSTIEASVVNPDEGQPCSYMSTMLRKALPRAKPRRDREGQFVVVGGQDGT